MAGPWEKYQTQEAKPWDTYAQVSPVKQEEQLMPKEKNGILNDAYKFVKGAAIAYPKGMTLGFSDEIKAALAAPMIRGYGAVTGTGSTGSLSGDYEQALNIARQQEQQAAEEAPVGSFLGELAGGIGTSIGAASKLGGTQLAKLATTSPIRTAAGVGGVSGGIYGFGTGEEGIKERLRQAGVSGLLGAGLGGAGSYVGKKIGGIIGEKVSRIPAIEQESLQDIVTQRAAQSDLPSSGISAQSSEISAINKVIERLKKDYPDNWQQVLDKWRQSEIPLASVSQKNLTNLAKGAAQYPSGEAITQKYFEKEMLRSPERLSKELGVNNFYKSVDDVLSEGRKIAAPLYEEAFQKNAPVWTGKLNPEINSAIKSARAKYPSELRGFSDNSVKVLDKAKQELDAQIASAKQSGDRGFVSSRTKIKEDLLQTIDRYSPEYKLARMVAGDYLSTEKAMQKGLDIFKPSVDVENLASFGSASEKNAYKEGVKKAISTQIDRVQENANPYKSILGTPEKQKKLISVLSPSEYKKLEGTLKAEDRLFKMRNEVIGGSPTASKALAASSISDGGQEALVSLASGGPKAAGFSVVQKIVKGAFDGLNDKTAEKVARLMYETDPSKKLLMLDMVGKSKNLTKQEKTIVKKAYFAYDALARSRIAGATTGGEIGGIMGE